MPKPSQSGKKRFFYNQNLKRDKSSKKYKNLTDHTITLIKRLEKEGMTKLIANALNKAQAKIKSYGITLVQMTNALEHKGLSALINSLSTHLVFVQKKGHNVSISKKRDIIVTSKKIVASDAPATEKKAPAKKTTTEKVEKEVVKKTPVEKKVAVKKAAPKKEATEKKPTTKKTTK
jgi:hypothetical protein